MQVTYKFDLNSNDGNNDDYLLKVFNISQAMFDALDALENICRDLNKGYRYYKDSDNDDTSDESTNHFSQIDVDLLLTDLQDVLTSSNISNVD